MSEQLVLVELVDEESLVGAAGMVLARGATDLEALTPIEVSRLTPKARGIAGFCFACGAFGILAGYFIQLYTNLWGYPLDVGGRPLHSAVAFVPLTYAGMMACASIGTFLAFLWSAGLPRFAHPTFAFDGVARATQDRFVLCFTATPEAWEQIRPGLDEYHPAHVEMREVEP